MSIETAVQSVVDALTTLISGGIDILKVVNSDFDTIMTSGINFVLFAGLIGVVGAFLDLVTHGSKSFVYKLISKI